VFALWDALSPQSHSLVRTNLCDRSVQDQSWKAANLSAAAPDALGAAVLEVK
jgi:hypothetical protein